MTVADLLPSNATRLERDLSRAGDFLPRLGSGVQRIRNAKRENIPDSVVPWLIYEYGLGEILPFVPDLRQALADGIQWQRVRGTRAAVEIGLNWIGFEANVEESEASTLRWADFQLGLGQAPNGLEFTNSVIQISRLSAPVRSRLFRIHGGYDHRRFRLDDHELSGGSWLCDHTGVYLREDWPQLSFGRQFHESADILTDATANLSIQRILADEGIYEDRFILSNSHLSDLLWRTWHMEAERVTISRGHLSFSGPWWQNSGSWGASNWDQGLDWAGLVNKIAPPREFAKAGIYLSDGAILEDTNTCFSARFEAEVGAGAFLLSEGDPATGDGLLSQHKQRIETVEWLERLEREHASVAIAAADAPTSFVLSREHKRVLPYDDTFRLDQHLLSEWWHLSEFVTVSRGHVSGSVLLADGEGWGAWSWLNARGSWASTHEAIEIWHQYNAHITLSEWHDLGETLAVLGFQELERLERSHQIEQLTPSDAGGGLAALDRLTMRVLPYDDSFTLDQHLLSEFQTATDEQAISRGHTSTVSATTFTDGTWGSYTWSQGADWWAQLGLEGYLQHHRTGLYLSDSDALGSTHAALGWPESERIDRIHQAEAIEDRQTFTTRQHTRSAQFAFVHFAFYGWTDPITWSVGATSGWSDTIWQPEMWVEGNGYWNPTSPLIQSSHQSTT
jgi:P2-related tail formation protein